MKKYLIYSIFVSLAFVACKKDILVTSNVANVPVIQSFLIAGSDSINVKVFTLKPYTNDSLDTTKPISGLKLYINNLVLTENSSGNYSYSSKDLHVNPLDTYSFTFEYNNKQVSSKTTIPSKPQNFKILIDTISVTQQTTMPSQGKGKGGGYGGYGGNQIQNQELQLTWDNPSKDYHYMVVEWIDTVRVYTNTVQSPDNIRTRTVSSPNQDNFYTINERSLRIYGKYRAVLCKINKEYYDLLSSKNLNSNDMINPPSNVTNGWGVFTSMSTDTVYFWLLKK